MGEIYCTSKIKCGGQWHNSGIAWKEKGCKCKDVTTDNFYYGDNNTIDGGRIRNAIPYIQQLPTQVKSEAAVMKQFVVIVGDFPSNSEVLQVPWGANQLESWEGGQRKDHQAWEIFCSLLCVLLTEQAIESPLSGGQSGRLLGRVPGT